MIKHQNFHCIWKQQILISILIDWLLYSISSTQYSSNSHNININFVIEKSVHTNCQSNKVKHKRSEVYRIILQYCLIIKTRYPQQRSTKMAASSLNHLLLPSLSTTTTNASTTTTTTTTMQSITPLRPCTKPRRKKTASIDVKGMNDMITIATDDEHEHEYEQRVDDDEVVEASIFRSTNNHTIFSMSLSTLMMCQQQDLHPHPHQRLVYC